MTPSALMTMACCLALAGCAAERPATADASRDTAAGPPFSMETLPPEAPAPLPPGRPQPPRPAFLDDSVRIEGSWQRERLDLVRSPAGFQPPFSTYVPADLRTEFFPGDTSPSVRFVAAFAGRLNPDAYLQVKIYPPGSSELVARTSVDAFLRERDPREERVAPSSGGWPWTDAAWDFDYTEAPGPTHFIGTIGIARHRNRYLHVLAHYPAEYGDGVGPRFHRILQEWRWEDDGSRLMRD